ncbi:MAG: biotin transporter BioY [Acetobacteraceae bacterium]|nr:biotin transporter BioY [Acetobacteraceae bacterium]
MALASSQSLPSLQSLARISLFAALVGVLGLLPKIDLPVGVPITAQTLGVMLAGCLLGPARAFLALLLFLGAVALGLPLLTGGRGGLGVFMAPSAGFLLGFPVGAAVTGLAMRKLPGPVLARAAVASALGGIGAVYLCGVPVLAATAQLNWHGALIASSMFLPGDLVKCVLSAFLVQTVLRGLPEWQPHGG